MTLMYHPNKQNPQRIRVQDKVLGIQTYFKLEDEAAARAYEQELREKRKFRHLRQSLPINRIFKEDGSVRGLKRLTRNRPNRASYECLSIQVTTPDQGQKRTEIMLKGKKFDEAYRQAQDKILELLQLERTPEISIMFAKTKRLYW
ncbi:hypothetical protein C2869_12195 [Saccharobesus litoralis]|uniref:Uncharacterized protein n=1 Tax=Saccharobesus litoralis TaxID=2172099 RepID=A0A2S0VSF4_9ALTE|nr:hypothetical protein [Saccharobesus litoralis]AWB67148.1 hypothetical protein C2869_12195 [Saccharobesus litoralis]